MSKWSSARSKAGALVFIVALAVLAGCNQQEAADRPSNVRASTQVDPEMRVDAVAEEEPAVARSMWRAANETARDRAGNLRVSIERSRGGPLVFAFANGVTIRAQPINVTPANQHSGVGGQSFAAVMGGDPRVEAHIYRVLEENVTRSASAGGLCGGERTTHLAVSEFVDNAGRWVFKLAAFRGEGAPGTSGEDPGFCSAYTYVASG